MNRQLLFNYFLKQQVNYKNIFVCALMLFLSTITLGQNYNDVIKNHLSNTLDKFNLLEADVAEWKITNEVFSKQSKVTHVYIQQVYKGIPIFNAVSNISIKDNKVIFASTSFIKNISSKVNATTPVLKAKTAIIQTASQLKLGSISSLQLIENKNSKKFIFSKSGISQENIPVELVYQPLEDGSIKLSWLLNVYQLDGVHWWNVRVDANSGRILQKNDWGVNCNYNIETGKHSHTSVSKKNNSALKKETSTLEGSQYNVFALPVESPNHGARAIVSSPENTTASPFGWHDTNGAAGAEFTITRGNNVLVQLDDNGNNGNGYSSDGGAGLNFDFQLDFVNKTPDTYKDASLTNLFYMNNVMHDIWYQYGFDEASGNFQTNNYDKGGNGTDEVFADGQDGSGRNNANFGTPPDGQNPRMQMFVWDDDLLVTINTSTLAGKYSANDARFTVDGTPEGMSTGAPVHANTVTADLIVMNDGSANPTEGCQSGLFFGLTGKIAVIRRGNCNFTDKIMVAQMNGAVGVIMVNNEPGAFSMGGGTATINIPAVSVTQAVGESLITAIQNGETINTTLINYGIDGSFDNGIIAHEYGHGISNRLVGGPSNSDCLSSAEQQGEGWSDYFGLAITIKPGDTETTTRGVGTFAANQPTTGNGIRQYPYTTDMAVNPFTFKNVEDQGGSVHGIGSIWATMLWDLNWKMIGVYGFDSNIYNGTGGNNKTMQLVIEGLKLTPCNPSFVDARNAIIAADDALNGGVNKCLLWQVFARRGLGYSASSGSADSLTDQTEAFDMPPASELGGASCTLSLQEEGFKIFNIYPNPSNGVINISLSKSISSGTISIYDINGRKVYSEKSNFEGKVSIKVNKITPGVYVLKINNETINYSEKIIIN